MDRLQRLFPAGPKRVVITDGGCGTELIRHGLALGESADLWNLSRPEIVEAVARSYVEAGAEVLLTNSFQANPIALARSGFMGQAEAVNRRGVEIARRASASAPDRVIRVFGSIGPIGAARIDAFALPARALAVAGVDALVLETFSDLDEVRAAVAAALPLGPPIIVSFHFDPRTGPTPEAAAAAAREAGADAVGANCGAGPGPFPDLCRRLRNASGLPVWIKPNAGLPTIENGRAIYPTASDSFAALLPALVAAGAGFVGGCCGAGPDFIRALVAARARISSPDLL
jgi:methionine synthase I (cobalamin-dependent)